MKSKIRKTVKAIHFITLIFAWLLFPQENFAQTSTANSGLGLRLPDPPGAVKLFEPEIYGLEFLNTDSALFRKLPSIYKRTVKMDTSGLFISFGEGIDQTELVLPAVVDLETYIRLHSAFAAKELTRQIVLNKLKKQVERSSGAIELDIPFRIKSKMFSRIFGSDRIGLRVTGNITFDLSGRTEKRSGSAVSAIQNQNTFSPRFKQTQQFTVEGKIGDKVTVSVEQNSEATTDIENTLRLHYTGDEDEIVQKIEAGNISLSLPSTKYVIFGGSNKGLFGLKSQLQIGNLHVTTIASLEKGQQQQLSISGGASEQKVIVKDTDFIKNRYFFADMTYRNNFENGFKDDPQVFSYQAGTEILQLEIWESTTYDNTEGRTAVADIDVEKYLDLQGNYTNVDLDNIVQEEGKIEKGFFRRLKPNQEYTFDKYLGYFKLSQPIENNKILAVAYVTAGANAVPVGTLNETLSDTNQVVVLKLIKPRAMQPSYSEVWPLMMRNVYSLGGSNIEKEGFDLRLEKNVTGEHATYPEGGSKSYLTLLQMDVMDENNAPLPDGDEKIDNNPYIIDYANGILMIPVLQPFNPDSGSRFKADFPEDDIVDIYELSDLNTSDFLERSKFEMIVTSKSTRSTFDLGFYVLEGSEVVSLGGKTLERDIDYSIDYFSGQLTLLTSEAKRASSQLDIKYERANLFQLNKKTIFGGRMEYRFWENSFVGLTALYLNKTTLDRRVRVGQEPFTNFVWDVNAAFKFKPRFLTKMVDALPGIETSAESQFNIEGEFAQVLPNPNTLNSASTGDNNGVAYVDDFESSKRTTTLGIPYKTWTMASAPKVLPNLGEDELDIEEVSAARGNIAWFNPYLQTPIKSIWPNRDVNSQTGQTTTVLGIDIWRDEGTDADSAWAGIMRSTINFPDQQKTKYIELWIKGSKGTVNVDIGRISEDWYIKGQTLRGEASFGALNTEDGNNNGLLEPEEDTGIDGIPDGQPGDTEDDDWREPRKNSDGVYIYDGINGTEGDIKSRGTHYPDTEDLDGDGQLSVTDQYFEYSFSLDSTSANARKEWITGSTPQGWKQYRIPLKEPSRVIGTPDEKYQQIFFTRLWFSDLPEGQRHRIKIATFEFVGNEWEENGIAEGEGQPFVKNDSLFTLATYNTEENAEALPGLDAPAPYTSPPGVSGVRDRITNTRSKEQSLVMRLFDLQPGQIAEARKTLYQPINVTNYENLRMFVHGDHQALPETPLERDSSAIQFYLRFGADAKNYYEYGMDVYQGWSNLNKIDIDLDEMASIKSDDSLFTGREDSLVYIKMLDKNPGSYYKARGKPSLRNIRYFVIGVRHRGSESIIRNPAGDFTGEIWLDELRLSNVRKENATALRISTSLKLADLLTFNGQWESKDADFHNVSEQFGKGNTDERQNYSGKINLDKFLPDSWDLQVPVDGRASFSRSIPKYRPKTDELTGYKNNSISKKLKSLFGLRQLSPELDAEISKNEVYGLGFTIKKRSKSRRWYLKYFIDGLNFDFDYSRKNSSNWEYLFNRSEQYKESIKYSIPFGKKNFFEPLKFLAKVPVLKKLSSQKLYYLPSSVNMSLNISDSETEQKRRSAPEVKRVVNTGATRSISVKYKLIPSIDFTYNRNHKADADLIGLKHEDMLKEIITKGRFGLDTDIGQSFKGDYRPKLVDWLKTDFSYSSNFSYQLTNSSNDLRFKNSSIKMTKRVNLTLNPEKLVKAIYEPKKKTKAKRGRRSRGRSRENTQEEEKPKEESKFSFPNPLMVVYDFLAGWRSIKTTVTLDDRIAHKYLSAIPDWNYQFGFSRDPGVAQDMNLDAQGINLTGPTSGQNLSIRTSTSLDLFKNVSTSFTHNYSTQDSRSDYGKNRSGNETSSYLVLGDDPGKDFNGLSGLKAFAPDWNVQVKGLEKIWILNKAAKSITIEHGHSSKYTANKNLNLDREFKPTSETFSNNWQPLVGVAVQTVWGVNTNMRLTSTSNYAYSQGAGATKTVSDALTFSVTYNMRGGFKVPLPFWPFKGRTIKNEINFNLTFDSSRNQTYQRQFQQKSFIERQDNKTWKLRPSATYRFSSRVQGSFFYGTGATKNKTTGTYSYNEFGINVNIAIHD